MVQKGRAEVLFEDTTMQTLPNAMDTESTAKPKFKLITSGGKTSRDEQLFSCGYGF